MVFYFLIIGISNWVLHCMIKRELYKLKNDFYIQKEEAMKYKF